MNPTCFAIGDRVRIRSFKPSKIGTVIGHKIITSQAYGYRRLIVRRDDGVEKTYLASSLEALPAETEAAV